MPCRIARSIGRIGRVPELALAGADLRPLEALLDQPNPQAESSQISDEITHALHRSWFFDADAIVVTDDGGKVRLSGTVGSMHDRRRAAVAAWSHPNVTDVINDIRVV